MPSPPHSLEPEVEGDQLNGMTSTSGASSWGRRDVVRSTIYSGFRSRRTAMKKNFEGRHHSAPRRSTMGSPSGGGSGSSLESSRPPALAQQTRLRNPPMIQAEGRYLAHYTMAGRYLSPRCSIETITHNNRLATAVMAFFLPRRFRNPSKMLRQRFVRRTKRQAASTNTQRNSFDPSLVIPSSLRCPADSRPPGARPA